METVSERVTGKKEWYSEIRCHWCSQAGSLSVHQLLTARHAAAVHVGLLGCAILTRTGLWKAVISVMLELEAPWPHYLSTCHYQELPEPASFLEAEAFLFLLPTDLLQISTHFVCLFLFIFAQRIYYFYVFFID